MKTSITAILIAFLSAREASAQYTGDVAVDSRVDGGDLGVLLAGWGQFTPCSPEPEYPCVKFGGGWIEPPGQ